MTQETFLFFWDTTWTRGFVKTPEKRSGPVQALRETPPARRGFTLADQVNQLVGASEADPDLGFMARLLALCSLPRTNPGNRQLRALNCCGPIRREALFMRERGWMVLVVGLLRAVWTGRKGTFRSYQPS